MNSLVRRQAVGRDSECQAVREGILTGECLKILRTLPDESVQMAVTSPPYWGLRDYGVPGQIGLERTYQEYVLKLVLIFREVRRVLKSNGTLWLNLGDSYANDTKWGGSTVGKHVAALHGKPIGRGKRLSGLKSKDLIMIPARVAIALQEDGWYLRSDIIWHKPNPMPESVTDRPTKSHEYLFLLSKSAKYFYDADAIREPFTTNPKENYPERARITGRGDQGAAAARGNDRGKSGGFPPKAFCNWGDRPIYDIKGNSDRRAKGQPPHSANSLGRNRRSVWTIATKPYKGAHFATFPPKLIEPCILAGSRPGDVVLDPFAGACTTGLVAHRHGRQFLGIELNPAYVKLGRARLQTALSDRKPADKPAESTTAYQTKGA